MTKHYVLTYHDAAREHIVNDYCAMGYCVYYISRFLPLSYRTATVKLFAEDMCGDAVLISTYDQMARTPADLGHVDEVRALELDGPSWKNRAQALLRVTCDTDSYRALLREYGLWQSYLS